MASSYPKEWLKIRARIRERAGNRCEQCGVAEGETYNRRSGRVVSEKEFQRLGKAATRAREQRVRQYEEALRLARERFLSPLISEAEMAGDYDRGYLAEGGFIPFDNERIGSLFLDANNTRVPRLHVHHIDEDKSNNDDSNLELLCKRCHMFKHAV
jgi:hypothetical protein